MSTSACLRCSLLLAALLLALSTAAAETLGLTQLPGSGDECSDPVLMYTCVTTGRGATELILDSSDTPLVVFLHSQYANGATVNESRLNGDIVAGTLSRSTERDCFDTLDNVTDYCYSTSIIVRLTERTRCKTMTCQTRVRIGMDIVTPFGNASLIRRPPTPVQPRAVNQSMDAATFTWDPGRSSCSNTLYNVSTTNCGTCNGSISTYNRSVTCEDLNPEQECTLSIRSSLECDVFSDPLVYMYTVPQSTTTSATKERVNTGARAGGITGGILACIIAFVVLLVIIAFVVVIHRRKIRNRHLHSEDNAKSTPENGQQITPTSSQNEETQEVSTVNDASSDHKIGETTTDITTTEQRVSHDQSILSESKETVPLLPRSHDSSAAAAPNHLFQPDDELQAPEQSSEDIHVQQALFITGHQAATNDAVGHHDEFSPAVATSRGAEPLIGLVSAVAPFIEPMEGPAEEGRRLEQGMDRYKYKQNGSQNSHEAPTGNGSYGLSDSGMIPTQVASRSNSGKVGSQPVEDGAPSTTVGISNTGHGNPKLRDKSASEDHPYGVEERIRRLEDAKHERDERINKQDEKIDEHGIKIDKIHREVEELHEKITDLEKVHEDKEEREQEIQSLKKDLKLKQAKIDHLEKQGYRCSNIKYRRYESTPV